MTDNTKTVDDLLNNASFVRWAEGKADSNEALKWDRWCKKNSTNWKLAIKAQKQLLGVTTANQSEITHTELQWLKFVTRINNENNFEGQARVKRVGLWWYRIAAMILVAVTAGLLTYSEGIQNKDISQAKGVWHQVKTDYAEYKKITLSDGSSIILGAHSSLEYPTGWVNNNSIEVRLKGEAYFHISEREKKEPAFRVKTNDGVVEVLGTRFTVDTEKERTRVVLKEGAVKITKATSAQGQQGRVIQLEPNEMIEFSHSTSLVKLKKVNPEVYMSWTKNELTLDNTSFQVLIDRIRKTFGVRVTINNSELFKRRLTGTLNIKSLDHLVNAIAEVLQIKVKQENNSVIFG